MNAANRFTRPSVSKTKRADGVEPCECGYNRWRTVVKGKEYECRHCGRTREVVDGLRLAAAAIGAKEIKQ